MRLFINRKREGMIKKPETTFKQLNKEATMPIGKLIVKILDDDRLPNAVRLEYYKELVEVLTTPIFIVRFDESEGE